MRQPFCVPRLYCCQPSTLGDPAERRARRQKSPPFKHWTGFSPNTAVTDDLPSWTQKRKRLHESGMRLVGDFILKNGKRFGSMRLTAIDTAVADALYERLLVVKE